MMDFRSSRLIGVEVDYIEETSAVCNQKAGWPLSINFNPFPPGYGNRRMLRISVWIRLYAYVLCRESNSWID